MSSGDTDDWFSRFAGCRGWFGSGGRDSIFSASEEMRREKERMLEETIQNAEQASKDLEREYQTPAGGKVSEVGPIVYGYSVTAGPDGKPTVRQFGNVKPAPGTARGPDSMP
jgi:HSP20 family protein